MNNEENKIPEAPENVTEKQTLALDDERRIKVLSPGMLVFKRFMRNKLAIAGSVIIIAMFLFSFGGALVNPYSQSQVFSHYVMQLKDFAAVSINQEFRYVEAEGQQFPSAARARMILALGRGETVFEDGGNAYNVSEEGKDFYLISGLKAIAGGRGIRGSYKLEANPGETLPEGFVAAFEQALADGTDEFTFNDMEYILQVSKVEAKVFAETEIALASKLVYETADGNALDFKTRLLSERALNSGEKTLTVGDTTYVIETDDDVTTFSAGGEFVFSTSHYALKAAAANTVFTADFKLKAQQALNDNSRAFTAALSDGTEQEFVVERKNNIFNIRREIPTYVIADYAAPSKEHILGTDGNGMDMMTRLMYGGRISLMIGFVVVLIEIFIGVVLGGLAGYFGKWVDNLIMRLVDIFNCIPNYPVYIILGAIMDAEKIDSTLRIYILMVALGILGWPGIARIVRGQILSLREQEFMTAAEATGISVSRRIFKHLVPNVIPQLIVIATMSLGGIILTEATLSFLGLGVKYPMASWGSIINAVSDSYVMTNYLFVWIPAGMLILLTVLGFNFIGDGLRDAFDPKMKR